MCGRCGNFESLDIFSSCLNEITNVQDGKGDEGAKVLKIEKNINFENYGLSRGIMIMLVVFGFVVVDAQNVARNSTQKSKGSFACTNANRMRQRKQNSMHFVPYMHMHIWRKFRHTKTHPRRLSWCPPNLNYPLQLQQ